MDAWSVRQSSKEWWSAAAGLIALVWIVFGQTVRHGFINFDDNQYIYENARIVGGLSWESAIWAFTHSHAKLWHPLTTISHMADCQWYGLWPGGHHLTNVILHTVAVVLLFVALTRMTGALWRSAFVAALFAIHPLKVESVAWIAERKDVLSGVFFALTLLAYHAFVRRRSAARYLVLCLAFAAGLMAKATLVTVPFVLLLLDYWPLQRLPLDTRGSGATWRQVLTEKIPLLLLSTGASFATLVSQTPTIGSLERFPVVWRINNALVSYVIYLGQLFWPVKLGVFYPHPENHLQWWQVVAATAFLVCLTIVAVLVRRRCPYLSVGWFWYLGMLVPVIGFVQVGLQGRADRFTYLPHVGLYIAATWGAAELAAHWKIQRLFVGVAAAAVVLVAASVSFAQTTYWKDSITLWNRTLAVTSNNDVAHLCLAAALMSRGETEQAIEHSREAARIRIDNAGAYGHVPMVFNQEETERAIAHWQERLRDHPEDVPARNNLGVLFFQSGRVIEAIGSWQKSLQVFPDDGNAQNNLAWVYATYPDDAVRDASQAVELAEKAVAHPGGDNPTCLRTLAAAYADSGRYPDALTTAKRARENATMRQDSSMVQSLNGDIALYERDTPLRISGFR